MYVQLPEIEFTWSPIKYPYQVDVIDLPGFQLSNTPLLVTLANTQRANYGASQQRIYKFVQNSVESRDNTLSDVSAIRHLEARGQGQKRNTLKVPSDNAPKRQNINTQKPER